VPDRERGSRELGVGGEVHERGVPSPRRPPPRGSGCIPGRRGKNGVKFGEYFKRGIFLDGGLKEREILWIISRVLVLVRLFFAFGAKRRRKLWHLFYLLLFWWKMLDELLKARGKYWAKRCPYFSQHISYLF